jgi:ferredoxin
MLYIDPVECIDCGACVPVCPVSAIFALDDLPEKWNTRHSRWWPRFPSLWASAPIRPCSAWRTRSCCGRFLCRIPSELLNLRSQLRGHGSGFHVISRITWISGRENARFFRADGLPPGHFRICGRPACAAGDEGGPAGQRQLLRSVPGHVPQIGRVFRRDEDAVPGRDAVAVISHDLWQQDFGSSPNIVGQKDPARWHRVRWSLAWRPRASPEPSSTSVRPLYVPLMMAPAPLERQSQPAHQPRRSRIAW